MKLDAYLKSKKINDSVFAVSIGKERSLVNKYRTGKVVPPLQVIAEIHKATRGKVSFRDFLATPTADTAA